MSRSISIAVVVLVAGCQQTTPYQRMLETELARTDTLRELFLNYSLGMSRQAFYDSSWALNRRGLVMQGPANQNVQYKLGDQLPYPASMLFYPDFADDQIARMRVRFLYDHWAPWNTRLTSDSLLMDVKGLMTAWYGAQFVTRTVTDQLNQPSRQFVSIQANREILIGRHSDQEVFVNITDLRNPPSLPAP